MSASSQLLLKRPHRERKIGEVILVSCALLEFRAAAAYALCVNDSPGIIAFGIESGLVLLHGEYFDLCVCSVFDGCNHRLGLSSGFAVPPAIMHQVLTRGIDLSKACKVAGRVHINNV